MPQTTAIGASLGPQAQAPTFAIAPLAPATPAHVTPRTVPPAIGAKNPDRKPSQWWEDPSVKRKAENDEQWSKEEWRDYDWMSRDQSSASSGQWRNPDAWTQEKQRTLQQYQVEAEEAAESAAIAAANAEHQKATAIAAEAAQVAAEATATHAANKARRQADALRDTA